MAIKTSSFIHLTVLLLVQLHCTQKENSKAVSFTEPEAPADALFQYLQPAETGIDFANILTETHEQNILTNSYLYNGGGVAVLDINKDGLQDLYFVSTQGSCKLYQNLGGLKFKEVTEAAGVAAREGEKTGVTVVDVNADGWQDLYVCRTGMKPSPLRTNLLFINNQNGTFSEKAASFGLDDAAASNHANFFDADNDGDLDCYVLNYPPDFKKVNSARVKPKVEGSKEMTRMTEPENEMESDHFYLNNGDGTFRKTGKERGIWNRAMGLSVTVSDLNNDGFMDIMVGNDYIEPDFVYMNDPARPGYFTDKSSVVFRHSSNHTMGVDIADINQDGWMDLVALDMLAESYPRQKELMSTMIQDRYATLAKLGYGYQQMRNVLQLNNGDGTFSEVGCLAGIYQTDWSWGPLLADFNNDGLSDLFIGNGYRRDVTNWDYLLYTADSIQRLGGLTPARFPDVQDYLKLIPETPLQNYMYEYLGDLQYKNVSTEWGLTQLTYSNGSVYTDLDNDGDLELVVNNLDSPAGVYKNRSKELQKGGNWLQIKVEGTGANPFGVGSKIRVTSADGQVQYTELSPTRGFFSSVEVLVQVGLGASAQPCKVEVEIPGAGVVLLEQVLPNQRLTVRAAEAKPGKIRPAAYQPNFKTASVPVFQHKEDEMNDFNRERLLPWETGKPGPSLAVGDVNKDGLDDFYVGNGPGVPGGLFVASGSGYRSVDAGQFALDAELEDTGACFLDADGDGDLDLAVASGGNSYPSASKKYPVRLYLNDGKGAFVKSGNALPLHVQNIHCLSAYDYDQDGDDDLFAGGGIVPGGYPLAPNSHVLRSDRGVFTDVTSQVAPAFAKVGMVRCMLWADLDGDRRSELVVGGEWMPLQVFKVETGKMVLASNQYGLENTHGFWRSLAAADLDQDGDLDLVAGNLGLNTRYTASLEAPLRLHAKDFDSNGSIDPIMTQMEQGREVPVAMRDLLIKQLPPLKKKYVRFSEYAKATLQDVLDEKDLKGAQVLQCNTLVSTVFMNQSGRFSAIVLPRMAQVAPINGVQAVDIDRDGDLDLLVAGNEYGQQVETGRLDAGNGAVLMNLGAGQFKVLPAVQTGFWANKEARAIAVLKAAGGKRLVLVANNNDMLQGYTF